METAVRDSFEVHSRQISEAKQVAVGAHRRLDSLATLSVTVQQRLAGVIASFALAHGRFDLTPDQIARKLCGLHSPEGEFVQRALGDPAATSLSSWAAQLTTSGRYDGVLASLAPQSVYAQLTASGLRADLGRRAQLSIPGHAPAALPGGVFVGEGQPISVRQFFIDPAVLMPRKAGVLCVLTAELVSASTPATIPLIERLIAEDVALSLDSVLLDSGAANATRPAGLLAGATGLTPSAAESKAEACADDLANLAAFAPPAVDLVYIMTPQRAVSAAMRVPGFAALSVMTTSVIQASQIISIDASAFASATSDDGTFETTDAGALEMRDDPSAELLSGNPVNSLWQTNALGIRLLETVAWTMRMPNRVRSVTGVTW